MVLQYAIRVLLARENRRRDMEPSDDTYDDVYVMKIDEDGNRAEVKVSKVRVCSLWYVHISSSCGFMNTGRSFWISRIDKIETSDMSCDFSMLYR
jgi:hypothetical protein